MKPRYALLIGCLVVFILGFAAGARAGSKVAVIPLEVNSPDDISGLREAVGIKLTQQLADIGGHTVAHGRKVKRLLRRIQSETADKRTIVEVSLRTDSRYVVAGSITKLGETYSIDLSLFEGKSAQSLESFYQDGRGQEEFLAKVGLLADDVSSELYKIDPSAGEPPEPKSASEASDIDKKASAAAKKAAAVAGAATGRSAANKKIEGKSRPGASKTRTARKGSPKSAKKKGASTGDPFVKVKDTSKPIEIESNELEALNRENTVIFRGNVVAKQGAITIRCDTMRVIYKKGGTAVHKITADGNVVITKEEKRPEDRIQAKCQRAIYYYEEARIVLTGGPQVTKGRDIVRGNQITVFFDESRFTVQRARIKIQPRGFKGP